MIFSFIIYGFTIGKLGITLFTPVFINLICQECQFFVVTIFSILCHALFGGNFVPRKCLLGFKNKSFCRCVPLTSASSSFLLHLLLIRLLLIFLQILLQEHCLATKASSCFPKPLVPNAFLVFLPLSFLTLFSSSYTSCPFPNPTI